MNPLDLRGPEFLAFFMPYSVAVFAVAMAARWLWKNALGTESTLPRWSPGVYPREGDAYAIALVRGGPSEVARTVLGRLLSAGLIELNGDRLSRSTPSTWPALDPIEDTALLAFEGGGLTASQAESKVRSSLGPRLQELEGDLERQGMTPGPTQRNGYWTICGLALLLVPGLGLAKLLVALARGRTNVGILIVLLALVTGLGVYLLRPPRRTRAGDKYLAWLQESHRGLVNLVTTGRRGDFREMALIAGIYGLETLPAFTALHAALRPPPRSGHDSGGGCGGDGGGGSSCGGGGCGGGGCGGCGG
jgi:uncharacterized protein (TIGR04222 family)